MAISRAPPLPHLLVLSVWLIRPGGTNQNGELNEPLNICLMDRVLPNLQRGARFDGLSPGPCCKKHQCPPRCEFDHISICLHMARANLTPHFYQCVRVTV